MTKPPGKARPACTLRKRTSRPDLRTNTAPYPAPHRKPGFWYTTKSILSKKDNSGVEGAHKSEEAAERGAKYGVRKIKQGYRSHKLKPYREAAKAEKAAFKANVDFQYHKTLHENPQLTSNPYFPRFFGRNSRLKSSMQRKPAILQRVSRAQRNAPAKRQPKPPRKRSRQRRLWQDTRRAWQSLSGRCCFSLCFCPGCPLVVQCFPAR